MRTSYLLMMLATLLIVPTNLLAGDSLLDQLQTLEMEAGELAIKKEADCFKAIGHRVFCSCIRQKSPVGLSFLEYIAVLTTTHTKVLPDLTEGRYRKMVEAASAARRECAEKLP